MKGSSVKVILIVAGQLEKATRPELSDIKSNILGIWVVNIVERQWRFIGDFQPPRQKSRVRAASS